MGSTTPPASAHTFADWLMALVGEIPEQVLARVQHWMDAIANNTFSNALPGIDDTLMRLDVARSVTHWNARISSPPKPPGTNKIRQLQQVVHVPIDGLWGPQTDAALTLVRMAAFRHQITDVKALQRACGTTPDGQWGPASKAALTRTVKGIQTIIGVPADGAWGPKTDAAYQQFRLTNQRW
jgi:murein L,D-transpeptidase YcbB/YkuD